MSVEDQIAEIKKKIDDYHAEDIKRSARNRYEMLSYVLWAFTLAAIGLAAVRLSSISTIVSAIIAVVFVIFGFVTLVLSRRK